MTIGAVVAWLGDRSIWWLLSLPPVVLALVGLRQLHSLLWYRNRKREMERLGRDWSATVRMGLRYPETRAARAKEAAWCEWQRAQLWVLLQDADFWPGLGVPQGEFESFYRRRLALVDSWSQSEDHEFIQHRQASLLRGFALADADPAIEEAVLTLPALDGQEPLHFDS